MINVKRMGYNSVKQMKINQRICIFIKNLYVIFNIFLKNNGIDDYSESGIYSFMYIFCKLNIFLKNYLMIIDLHLKKNYDSYFDRQYTDRTKFYNVKFSPTM